jgi:hypothetical protein
MGRQILLNRIYGGADAVLLDTASGRATPAGAARASGEAGNMSTVAGHVFALYAEGPTLWFQWDDRRWPLAANDTRLAYRHDLARAVTIFSVNDRAVEYPAWWRGDPHFDPLVPERDEDEDYLGYVMAVKRDPALQKTLLDAWSGAA